MNDLLQRLLFAVLINAVWTAPTDKKEAVNTYDAEYGVYLGQLAATSNSLTSGKVYVVNETTLQVIDFSYTGKLNDAYFWLSRTDSPVNKDIVKVPTFMFGYTPLDVVENVKRVVLNLPGSLKVTEFKGLYVYSPNDKTNYGSVSIPDDVIIPKSHFLPKELAGKRYSVRSGPILIMDTRTIKIFAFNFDGDKAPDGYFFVGKGLHVSPDVGVKVAIRGKDTPDSITPMNVKYRGGKDIILDLPENYDVYHIDFLSVYCYKFHVDFANVLINNLPPILPPYVPVQQKYSVQPKVNCDNPWKAQPLLGTEARTNFTLQLGPAGGNCGYYAITGFRPAQHYVWYVNGYLAELYLKRGLNYTFNIEGGHNNSFYITDEPFGGYSNLESDEQKQVSIFAPKSNIENEYSERLCLWEGGVDSEMADKFGTFEEFRQQLHLECANHGDGEQKILQFNPDNSTPSIIYGNSYDQYGMGFKIHVVDELPAEIPDIHEPPFTFEAWTHNINEASSSVLTSSVFAICSLFMLNTIFGFQLLQ